VTRFRGRKGSGVVEAVDGVDQVMEAVVAYHTPVGVVLPPDKVSQSAWLGSQTATGSCRQRGGVARNGGSGRRSGCSPRPLERP
jgi:hypothetical protein